MRSETLNQPLPTPVNPSTNRFGAYGSIRTRCVAMSGNYQPNQPPAPHSDRIGARGSRLGTSTDFDGRRLVRLVRLVGSSRYSQYHKHLHFTAPYPKQPTSQPTSHQPPCGFRSLGRPARPFRPIGLRACGVSGPFDPTKPRAPEPGSTLRHPYRTPTRARASSRASDPCRSDWLSRVCGPNPASLGRGAVLPGLGVATVATAPLEPFSALPFGCDNARMFGVQVSNWEVCAICAVWEVCRGYEGVVRKIADSRT